MTTATKKASKKGPAVPSRDEVIAMVRQLGGEPEVKRYEKVEGLEKTHSQGDVLHHWKVGDIMQLSFEEHDDEAIRVYSVGLQRAPQTLRLSVRLAALYKEADIRGMLKSAANAGHELNWAHFRQLMREGISDTQRIELVDRVVKNRWGYRELKDVITAVLGGKRSQGGRKPGKAKYKTFAGALSAMKMRSKAWLNLEADWIDQVKILAGKMDEDERHTPEFLQLTKEAAVQLREVANRAQRDAEEAEALAAAVDQAMGSPELTLEDKEEAHAPAHTNGKHHINGKAKPRVRLARHPKLVGGKVAK
jgi:hypothetical protein